MTTRAQWTTKLRALHGASLTAKRRAMLERCAHAMGDAFAPEVDKAGLLEGAAEGGDLEAVALYLGAGADPNALPEVPTFGGRALSRLFEADLADAKLLPLCRTLLAHGADPNLLQPHANHFTTSFPRWASHRSAVDHAMVTARDALGLLLDADLTETTATSGISTAVFASGHASDHTTNESERRRRLRILEYALEELGPGASDRWGTTPLHVAAIVGNAEAARLLIEHGVPSGATVLHDVTYSDRHFAPIGGGLHDSIALPAGSTPLDVLDATREYLTGKRAAVRTSNDGVKEFEGIPGRLRHMEAVRAILEAHGETHSDRAMSRPTFATRIDDVLEAWVGEAYARARNSINLMGKGPWGYLVALASKLKPQLAALEPLAEDDPVAFMLCGGPSKRSVGLYDDDDYGDDSVFGELDVAIYPDDYPPQARALFDEAIMGMQGDDILILGKRDDGTHLYRVDRDRVLDEGTLLGGLLDAFAARLPKRADGASA